MRVGHARPFVEQDVTLVRVALGAFNRRAGFGGQVAGLIGVFQFGDQRLPRCDVRRVTQVDFLDRVASSIEELQAAARAPRRFLFDGKGKGPVFRENPRIDFTAQNHRRMRTRTIVKERAHPFMHTGHVTGQGHNLTQGGHQGHRAVGMRVNPRHAVADVGGQQFGLGNAKALGQIAVTFVGVLCFGSLDVSTAQGFIHRLYPCVKRGRAARSGRPRDQNTLLIESFRFRPGALRVDRYGR